MPVHFEQELEPTKVLCVDLDWYDDSLAKPQDIAYRLVEEENELRVFFSKTSRDMVQTKEQVDSITRFLDSSGKILYLSLPQERIGAHFCDTLEQIDGKWPLSITASYCRDVDILDVYLISQCNLAGKLRSTDETTDGKMLVSVDSSFPSLMLLQISCKVRGHLEGDLVHHPR